MINYEGETHHRRRGDVDLIDLLFYDAFGEVLPPDAKEAILRSMEDDKKKGEHSQKCDRLYLK